MMRVLLLQIRQDAKSRSANILSMMDAVDRAGAHVPAPDLLILPGACDTGGGRVQANLADALRETIAEMIAWKAREWGVHIAAGLHVRNGMAPCAVLFDPDGDRLIWSQPPVGGGPVAASQRIQVRACPVGRLGIFEASGSQMVWEDEPVWLRGAFIACPSVAATARKHRQSAEANVARPRDGRQPRWGAYWGVVSAAGASGRSSAGGPATFVCDPEGRLVASAPPMEEALVSVEVPLDPPDPSGNPKVMERNGRAD